MTKNSGRTVVCLLSAMAMTGCATGEHDAASTSASPVETASAPTTNTVATTVSDTVTDDDLAVVNAAHTDWPLGPYDLPSRLMATHDVVRVSSLEWLDPIHIPRDERDLPGDPDRVLHPYRIVIDDIVYHTPIDDGMSEIPEWHAAGSKLIEGQPLEVLEYHSAEAQWVTDTATAVDLVGLQRLRGIEYGEEFGVYFAITFLVAERPDGSWEFLDPDNGAEVTEQLVHVTRELDMDEWMVLHDFAVDVDHGNNDRSPSSVWTTVYRVAHTDSTEPTWWDEDPSTRPFTVDAAPTEVLAQAEAIGLDIDADDVLARSAPHGAIMLVTSDMGTTHAFSTQIGAHVVAGLRQPGEELAVVYVDASGEQTEIGRISDVPAGHVAVLSFAWPDRAAVPELNQVNARPPTEFEASAADAMGIQPDGSIQTFEHE